MPINTERLQEIYNTDMNSPENKGWIAIPDSKSNTLIANAAGSSGGNPGNGWKIHISIDPERISDASVLIAEALNEINSPQVSLKFAGKQLAVTGQPGKQVALIFYYQELQDKTKLTNFLNQIESLLRSNHIGVDPRPINSDSQAAETKYDAVIYDNQGNPTRFNYRNEQCIVMDDDLYNDLGGTGNTIVQGEQIWVKQSYYAGLPNSQKHNPGNRIADPLAVISSRINTITINPAHHSEYKPYQFNIFSLESNQQRFDRLVLEFEAKLESYVDVAENDIVRKIGLDSFIERAVQVKHAAIEYYEYSPESTIQALARLGMVLDYLSKDIAANDKTWKEQISDNFKQLEFFVKDLEELDSEIISQEWTLKAAETKRNALAVAICGFVVTSGMITVAIMFPPAAIIAGTIAAMSTILTIMSYWPLSQKALEEEQTSRNTSTRSDENRVVASQKLAKTSSNFFKERECPWSAQEKQEAHRILIHR